MILSLERLGAHAAHVFALVAVSELVFGQRRRVAEYFAAYLRLKPKSNVVEKNWPISV